MSLEILTYCHYSVNYTSILIFVVCVTIFQSISSESGNIWTKYSIRLMQKYLQPVFLHNTREILQVSLKLGRLIMHKFTEKNIGQYWNTHLPFLSFLDKTVTGFLIRIQINKIKARCETTFRICWKKKVLSMFWNSKGISYELLSPKPIVAV